jgi:hypothetical protein
VPSGQEASDNVAKKEKNRDPMDELFHSLAGIYGYLWTNMHKEMSVWASAKNQWRKGLREIKASQSEVNAALEKCRHLHTADGKSKLVNLQEFLLLIEDARKQEKDKNNFYQSLPKPAVDIRKARSIIDECYRKLGRKPKYA